MSGFTYVSLFSGIGGFEQALNKLGGNCVLASEIDKFANQAYEVLYGEKTVGDITELDAKDVPDHDLLTAGFPCQSFSVAGKRGGFDDARGTLFFEVARVASQKQPSVLLLENVKGLVGHDKGRTLDTIVHTLNDIGYRVDFDVLNSKFFGVPQNRERIFIVAVREDLVENEPWVIEGNTVVPKGKRRISGYDDVKTFNFDFPKQKEESKGLSLLLETGVAKRFYLNEEKTAQIIANLSDSDKLHAPFILHNIYGGFKEIRPRIFKEISPTIRTAAGGGHLPSILEANSQIRRITPLECFRLQGFSDLANQTLVDAGISDSQRYKMAGNAVTVNVVEAIGERLLPYLALRPLSLPVSSGASNPSS